MSNPHAIYVPPFCTGIGALLGLTTSPCISMGCLPVIIGSGVGCIYCIREYALDEPDIIIVQNIYTGEEKI
jgi:hypothetical protein